jgi:glutaconate CoA-transferase, subunit B
LGVLIPDPATRELQLASLHPGVTPARVKAATGWNIEVTPDLMQPRAPKPRELSALRIVA